MLTATFSGEPSPQLLGPEGETELSLELKNLLGRHARADAALRSTYNMLVASGQAKLVLPPALIQLYNDAQAEVVATQKPIIDKYLETSGTAQTPSWPPAIDGASTALSGLGSDGSSFVSISQLRVRDPISGDSVPFSQAQPVTALGDGFTCLGKDCGLGLPPPLIVFVYIAAVAIALVVAVGFAKWLWDSNERAKNEADAKHCDMLAEAARKYTEAYTKALIACVGEDKTLERFEKCNALAKSGADPLMKLASMAPPFGEGGWGFFKWVGVIAVIAGLTGVGIYIYKRRSDIHDKYVAWRQPVGA